MIQYVTSYNIAKTILYEDEIGTKKDILKLQNIIMYSCAIFMSTPFIQSFSFLHRSSLFFQIMLDANDDTHYTNYQDTCYSYS